MLWRLEASGQKPDNMPAVFSPEQLAVWNNVIPKNFPSNRYASLWIHTNQDFECWVKGRGTLASSR